MSQTNDFLMFDKDAWISQFLGKPCFHLKILSGAMFEQSGLREIDLPNCPCMIWARVPCGDKTSVSLLQNAGFSLVSVNLTFIKDELSSSSSGDVSEVRWANPSDESAVCEIAAKNFIYDRFHQDPLIRKDLADAIKREWTRNYFRGGRGTHMAVAQKEDCTVCGFGLLIKKNNDLTIDLIALDKGSQGCGFAAKMLRFIETKIPGVDRLTAGTQMENRKSVEFYERNGFRFNEGAFLFHYHKM
jgi:GNAT superfamily N-acetyltransferase